jgi:hypothetical protein
VREHDGPPDHKETWLLMASQDPRDCASFGAISPADEDVFNERAVLFFVLGEHPNQVTAAEVLRALCPDLEDFKSADAVQRAIRDLVAAGLLRRQGEGVLPTRATICLRRLEEQ